jgi:hypothetical protein
MDMLHNAVLSLLKEEEIFSIEWALPEQYERSGRFMSVNERKQVLLKTYLYLSQHGSKIFCEDCLSRLKTYVNKRTLESSLNSVYRYPWNSLEKELLAKGQKVPIFAFGSLINTQSASLSFTSEGNPALGFGFRRLFSYYNKINRNQSGCGLPSRSYSHECAKLNALVTNDVNDVTNGLVYEVDPSYFNDLREREEGYDLKKIVYVDFDDYVSATSKPKIKEAYIFSSPKGPMTETEEMYPHLNYLLLCVEGAAAHSEVFLNMFYHHTNLSDNKSALSDWFMDTIKNLVRENAGLDLKS